MVTDEKIFYFIGLDNIAVMKGSYINKIFSGKYKMSFFKLFNVTNLNENLISNDKVILRDNKKTNLRGNIVYYDILKNKPYIENLNVALQAKIADKDKEIERLRRENGAMTKILFSLKGTDRFSEEMLNFIDIAGKMRGKMYQGQGYDDMYGGLFGRYGGYSYPRLPPTVETGGTEQVGNV